MLFNKTY